jgi:hypothetical protein
MGSVSTCAIWRRGCGVQTVSLRRLHNAADIRQWLRLEGAYMIAGRYRWVSAQHRRGYFARSARPSHHPRAPPSNH